MIKIKLTIKQKQRIRMLCDALESGKYKQGYGKLRDEKNRFCCLGVACDIMNNKRWLGNEYLGSTFSPPKEVIKYYGMPQNDGFVVKINEHCESLMCHNDSRQRSFQAIAKAIREQILNEEDK